MKKGWNFCPTKYCPKNDTENFHLPICVAKMKEKLSAQHVISRSGEDHDGPIKQFRNRRERKKSRSIKFQTKSKHRKLNSFQP